MKNAQKFVNKLTGDAKAWGQAILNARTGKASLPETFGALTNQQAQSIAIEIDSFLRG